MSKLSHQPDFATSAGELSRFSANVTKELVEGAKQGQSKVVSPLSIALALRWLAEGCDGETRQEILTAINADKTINALTSFVENAKANADIILKTANKLYVRKDDSVLNDNFLSVSRDPFQAEIEMADFFKTGDTSKNINSWVDTQTNGKIKDMISPSDLSDPLLRSLLINAIYFRAEWESPFDDVATKPRSFYVTSSQVLTQKTMKDTKEFRYHEDEQLGAKMIEIPYKGGRTSLVVILPNEIEGLSDVMTKLAVEDTLHQAVTNLHNAKIIPVYVEMPAVITKTDIDLKQMLPKIGVTKIFEGGLTRVLAQDKELHVSRAIQKVYITIDEDGTEAVAVTGLDMYLMSATYPNLKVQQFKADHPFFYALMCDGVVLFTGGYSGPEEQMRPRPLPPPTIGIQNLIASIK